MTPVFINRELSWLEFNQRVLDEVTSKTNPLFEKLKFASIVCSNLDEFFMVRVASVNDQIIAGVEKVDPSGLSAKEIMERISARAHKMMEDLYKKYHYTLLRQLKNENIVILKRKDLDSSSSRFIESYFDKNIFPVLTPMVVDRGRPFPLILNKSLNIALLVAEKDDINQFYFATVQVPSVLDRLIELPPTSNVRNFMLLEDIIKVFLNKIFVGYHIITKVCYRITRNADLSIHEEGAEDLLEVIEESLKQRKWGAVIRLEIEHKKNNSIVERLLKELEITEDQVYDINGPIDLKLLRGIYGLKGYQHLLYSEIEPNNNTSLKASEDIFEVIRKNDILLHHPYQSFQPIIEFIQAAATDPKVLAIKQTLYRVSDSSPIIEALVNAAENGKQVTVMVEIRARFDEQNNIQWARRLETAGCHVIYGFAGLKTHCKVLLVVRREEDGIQRYLHLATGNYNEVTANLYTDLSILTANPHFGVDASNLFNMLSGLSEPLDMYRFYVAPYSLRTNIKKLINREKCNAKEGKKARITIKINSLVDKEMIEALYEASQAGVKIRLIVRGICCLVPNVPGLSDNITVISIVGRFLEHSRIYYFYNDGNEAVYLSSADLMERNLDRRVEVMFPIDDENIKKEIIKILKIVYHDTEKARVLLPDGSYKKVIDRSKKTSNCQDIFLRSEFREGIPV